MRFEELIEMANAYGVEIRWWHLLPLIGERLLRRAIDRTIQDFGS